MPRETTGKGSCKTHPNSMNRIVLIGYDEATKLTEVIFLVGIRVVKTMPIVTVDLHAIDEWIMLGVLP